MTMEQLSERSGVSPRTIRYYVSMRLLPSPGKGQKFLYSEDHLNVLLWIKSHQENGKSLDEIRVLLGSRHFPSLEFSPTSDPNPIFVPNGEGIEMWRLYRISNDVSIQVRSNIPEQRFHRVVRAVEMFFTALKDE
ncbi:MAG: MerR family transcriptional regulator [Bacteroidota bacterium]|jgi:DNA-binding transcriptional MerR regulator